MTEGSHPRFGLFNTEARFIHAGVIDQDYQIGIWFPFSYTSSSQRYPVLYVPDGEFAFSLVTGLIPTLIGTQEVPELLVVGIAYHGITSWQEHGSLRNRDFCPPGLQQPGVDSRQAAFTGFFRQELFPLIEREYRGLPEDRTLFGFSSAGLFALHVMLTQPGMFRRCIAASCTWPEAGQALLDEEQQMATRPDQPPADLFLAVGGLEADQLPAFQAITDVLRARHAAHLRLSTRVYDGEGHSPGVLARTFLDGVRTVFQS